MSVLPGAESNAPLNYDRDVRPILSENCFYCHGQDNKKRMAGLRLDSLEGATADRHGHAAIVPGKPEESLMYQRITAEQPARRMPPKYSNRTLTPAQIATLTRWIKQGGQYNKHWAFVPPVRPTVPDLHDPWVKQPIDAFVLKRLKAEGLHPSPAASPATWLRRVSLDLTGLAPTPEEFGAFDADQKARGEAAYESAVERLLASPRYGERMAIDWMDVARYADTHGFNNDSTRSMWRWRDWVIQSFNSNLPYDRFLTKQLAGDLLPNATLDDRIATGFGRNHVINSEGGIIAEEYRVEYVTDRVRTLGMAWMGLTLECAHCHDHKFDPITQRDHYRLFAFFNSIAEEGEDGRVANAVPIMPAPTAAQQQRDAELEPAIVSMEQSIRRREANWAWSKASGKQALRAASEARVPEGTVLQITCDKGNEFNGRKSSRRTPGVAGKACTLGDAESKPESKAVPIARRAPLTFSFWLQPGGSDTDVALFSAMDYAPNPVSTVYGKGTEVRLVNGEVEFRMADRFPAYSIEVRSQGAALTPGQWRHVAILYEGVSGRDVQRVHASWVRMFADGRELPVRVLEDDLAISDAKDDSASPTAFRLGWDNHKGSPRYTGALDEIAVWTKALTPAEITGVFEKQALPYAAARERHHRASVTEETWLRAVVLQRTDAALAAEMQKLDGLRSDWLALQRSFPTVMVMQDLSTPRETHVLQRGGYNAPGEKVEAGVPEQLLGAWPAGAPKNRLGLAMWLTKPDHPLTARVVVNRFWQQLFGIGLVKTSDNFGMQGEWPSHPELLDWMAREFVDSGWNVKALLKQIVLSSTYRQDSAASPDLVARDPENRLLARGPRFRLPAEIIRDQALEIAGLLKNRLGGPSVFPYQTKDLYKGIVVAANYPGTRYVQSTGDDLYRRSLYTYWKRTVPHPTMTVFDAPDREVCTVRRSTTNTPLQALTLLNDPIFLEASRKLAERSIKEGGANPQERLDYAFRLATGRAPDDTERTILRKTLDRMMAEYRTDAAGAKALLTVGASPADPSIAPDELAAYTAVANMILNLDEVITKG
ncbi:MAG: DUF1553 domain-containing protein [Bryobacteraceae bacterium]